MSRRRVPLAIVWPVALLMLVGLLATFQYRWLGEVSAAERGQMQSSLRSHADDFARDFDREIIRTYAALQSESSALQKSDWKTFAADYEQWKTSARYPQLVRDVYFVREPQHTFLRFDAAKQVFVPAPWPSALMPIRARLTPLPSPEDGALRILRTPESIVSSIPALVVTLPMMPIITTFSSAPITLDFARMAAKRDIEQTATRMMSFQANSTYVIAMLDREYIQDTVLPDLASRYFPEVATENSRNPLTRSEGYRLAVVPNDDLAHPVYARGLSAHATLDPAHADADVAIFTLRPDLADPLSARDQKAVFSYSSRSTIPGSSLTLTGRPTSTASRSANGQLSIVVQSDSARTGDIRTKTAVPAALTAGWQLVLQHSAGSLDAAVGQARLRNLTMSFGVLALLAASVGLIAINAQRAQRLALQQMDFVATVSHELRTPLAVIRAAAQNLSAGVIHEADHAKRYGDLIDAEGKRLTDMVEQVLEFAGLSGNRRPLPTRPVDAAALVHDVAASCATLLRGSGDAGETAGLEISDVEISSADNIPPVAADEAALRRALTNLITNAVKYGDGGQWIGVSIRHAAMRSGGEVQIAVSDHGRGIEPEDLPHIFEPFYRGRCAIDRQIHGNGLGLSLVKRIALAHGGRVTVKSVRGEGTTFTLHMPAAAPIPAMHGVSAPEAHGDARA